MLILRLGNEETFLTLCTLLQLQKISWSKNGNLLIVKMIDLILMYTYIKIERKGSSDDSKKVKL